MPEKYNAHNLLGQWILASGMNLQWDPRRSHGAYLYDSVTNQEFLDLFSFFAARPLAFNHPKLQNPEFVQTLGEIALHKPSNCDVYTAEYAHFVDHFARLALQEQFKYLFFISGGGPAVDNAIKAAIDWKHRKNIAMGRGAVGSRILHFQQAFHGRTGYALSATDSYDKRKTQFFPMFDWPRVLNPTVHFPLDQKSVADVALRETESLAEIQQAIDQYPNDIAAILIEPIQGEGGDGYFRSEFLLQLRQLCDAQHILLIFDEVQTGFGGTGKWWDWHHHGVQPDMMIFGKKTQVCGLAATGRFDEVESVFHVPSRISSTFEGNLTDMVRCSRIIDIIQEDHLIENAATMGRLGLELLTTLEHDFSQVTNVRGRGLWMAFDVPNTEIRDRILQACFKQHLLVLSCGKSSIRLRPALDIDQASLVLGVERLREALFQVLKKRRL